LIHTIELPTLFWRLTETTKRKNCQKQKITVFRSVKNTNDQPFESDLTFDAAVASVDGLGVDPSCGSLIFQVLF
jgi:hypothetical protein